MPVSSSTGNFDVSSRQGGLVTDGDFLQRKEVPGFAPQPFSFEQPGAQIKPPPKSNKHFNTNHNITFSTNQVLFLNDTYRRESMSKVFWDDIYGKTHGPGSTPQMRSNIQPLATPDLRQILRPTRSIAEYQPTPLEKRRRMLDLCYNSNLVLGSEPESARFATTYGELCAEAGTVRARWSCVRGVEGRLERRAHARACPVAAATASPRRRRRAGGAAPRRH